MKKLIKNVCRVIMFSTFLFASACGREAEPEIDLPQNIGILENADDEGGILRIATAFYDKDSDFGLLSQAIKIYEREFPHWKVEVQVEGGYTVYSKEASDAYEAGLPDRLLADGYGSPDIACLNYTYPKVLIQKNLLMDMLPFFTNDNEITINKLLPGVVDIIVNERGGMYSLPLSFSTRVLLLNDEIEVATTFDERPIQWDWMELPNLFEHQAEYLLKDTPEMLLHALLAANSSSYYAYDNQGYNVDTPVLREILSTVRYYYENGLIPDYNYAMLMEQGEVSEPDALFTYWMNYLPGAIKDYTRFELSTAFNSSVYYYPPGIRGSEGMSIQFVNEYAINANAPNKEAAWEFIKILLSDEVLKSVDNHLQPVVADLSKESVEWATGDQELTQEEVLAYNSERVAFFAGINHEVDFPEIFLLITGNAASYIKGETDLDSFIEYLQIQSREIPAPY